MLNAKKVALALAGIMVVAHVAWSLMVLMGLGAAWLGFILGLHFLEVQVTVLPFNLVTAIELWVIVGIVGYVVGYVFATIWNKVHTR